eukprot:CAMPEP_0116025904 /NCGR_PEP_ID=MMETSP0321-20121206/13426_1 /TAXON_ID=163516 /ORGANISM="Leptocylindrus danicus var. danicus, Strain B650" /LENGTH=57 /DNA_ID=CAMNT_0003498387 /DNA_START=36 /DNA_END=209 /DNA_ORIENTATION=+
MANKTSSGLPIPAQLAAQLKKCQVVRKSDLHKSRDKSAAEMEKAKSKLPPSLAPVKA